MKRKKPCFCVKPLISSDSVVLKGGELVQLGCRCRAIILFVPSAVGILIPLQTCYLCLLKHIFSLGISHRASFLEEFEFGASYYSVKQQQLKFCETLIVFRELRCEYPKVVRRPPHFWIKLRVSNLFENDVLVMHALELNQHFLDTLASLRPAMESC